MTMTLIIHHANEISAWLTNCPPTPPTKLKVRFRVRVTLDDVPPPKKILFTSKLKIHWVTLDIGQSIPLLQNERLDLELQQHLE